MSTLPLSRGSPRQGCGRRGARGGAGGQSPPPAADGKRRHGGVAERLKAHAWRACIRATVSRVRIPLPPPFGQVYDIITMSCLTGLFITHKQTLGLILDPARRS